MNDSSSPPPPYDNNNFSNIPTSSGIVFPVTKSLAEIKELIDSFEPCAATDELKMQLSIIQTTTAQIETRRQKQSTAGEFVRRWSSEERSEGHVPLPNLPIETDEESYQRIIKTLQGLISDASTAVESNVDTQVLLSTGDETRTETAAKDDNPRILEEKTKQSMTTLETIDDHNNNASTTTSRPDKLPALLSPLSTVLQHIDTLLSTGSIFSTGSNKSSQSDTVEESPLIERLFLYLRHHLRRTLFSVEPFVDNILLTPSSRYEISSLTTLSETSRDIEERRSTPWSTSRTVEFGPPGIRGFLYAIWWSFIFSIAACLWDAELVKFAGSRVEKIVTGTKDRNERTDVSAGGNE